MTIAERVKKLGGKTDVKPGVISTEKTAANPQSSTVKTATPT